MRRGTTPTFAFEVDADLTGWDVYISFEQYNHEILTKREPEIEAKGSGCVCSVELTQADTLDFKTGAACAQIRACKDGSAVSSTYFDFEVCDVILDGEIPWT